MHIFHCKEHNYMDKGETGKDIKTCPECIEEAQENSDVDFVFPGFSVFQNEDDDWIHKDPIKEQNPLDTELEDGSSITIN